ncbi:MULTISPECIES: aminotransferase class III-fold pyridoxal phosphate-dependent enzyme [unclassified Mesorhizobium]|uniref:aminotransferase class III-fold pyridoxal phosphate-dependent enzyme n=1 Tax=unclassified Mesorhizobium TaxID=325217 RepID=UPI0012EBDFE5
MEPLCHVLGSHPEVLAALHAQLDKIIRHSSPRKSPSSLLVARSPTCRMDRLRLSRQLGVGSDATLKMMRQYFVEKGEGRRRHIIALHQGYHGNTSGSACCWWQ